MHFGFALDLSDIDLWNIDLLETHLDLLDTDIPSKHFFVPIASSTRLQDMSLRHLQDMSSRLLQGMSSRRLQGMSWRLLQDIFRVTIFRLPRRLQDCSICRFGVLLSWVNNCASCYFKYHKMFVKISPLFSRRLLVMKLLVLVNISWSCPIH